MYATHTYLYMAGHTVHPQEPVASSSSRLAEQDGGLLVGTCVYIYRGWIPPAVGLRHTVCPVAAPESQSPQLLVPGAAVPLQLLAPQPALTPVTGTMDTEIPMTHSPTPAAGAWVCSPWSLPLLHHGHTGPPARGLAPAAALRHSCTPRTESLTQEKMWKGI